VLRLCSAGVLQCCGYNNKAEGIGLIELLELLGFVELIELIR
jgi:hypothetical protein